MNESHRDAVVWLKTYFTNNPDNSINDCMREASKKGLRASRILASKIRQEVVPLVKKVKVVSPEEEEKRAIAQAVANADTSQVKLIGIEEPAPQPLPPDPKTIRDEKEAWAWKYQEAHPEASPMDLIQKVKAKFGVGLEVKKALEIVRIGRGVFGLPATKVEAKIQANAKKQEMGAVEIRKPPILLGPPQPKIKTNGEPPTTQLVPIVPSGVLGELGRLEAGWIVKWFDKSLPMHMEVKSLELVIKKLNELRSKGVKKEQISLWMKAPFRIE